MTKAGRLDEAIAAREALKQLDVSHRTERLAGTAWSRLGSDSSEGVVKLLPSGLAVSEDGSWEARSLVTRWEHKGCGVVLLTIEQGRPDKLCEVWMFDPAWTSYKGYSFDGSPIEGKLAKDHEGLSNVGLFRRTNPFRLDRQILSPRLQMRLSSAQHAHPSLQRRLARRRCH